MRLGDCVAVLLLLWSIPSLVHVGSEDATDKPKLVFRGKQLKGSTFLMRCLTRGQPSTGHVTWFQDGRPLSERDQTLEIASLDKSHGGYYTCCTDNSSLCSDRKLLTVLRPPVLQAEPPGPIHVEENASLTITCIVNDSFPSVAQDGFNWTFFPDPHGSSVGVPLSVRRAELLLGPMSRDQAGRYQCTADNGGEEYGLYPGMINVTVRVGAEKCIRELRATEDITVQPGSDVILSCNVTGDDAMITWSKNGRGLRHATGRHLAYVIRKVTCADGGDYKCQASCGEKRASASTALVLQCPPTRQDDGKAPTSFLVPLGGDVDLSLSVYANPPPAFEWTRPGRSKPIASNVRHNATWTELSLRDVQREDLGVYTLTASNNLGFIEVQFTVLEGGAGLAIGASSSGGIVLWVVLGCSVAVGNAAVVMGCLCIRGLLRRRRNRKQEYGDARQERNHAKLSRPRQMEEEVADHASGEGTNPYMSIHSADLCWPPQSHPPRPFPSDAPNTHNSQAPLQTPTPCGPLGPPSPYSQPSSDVTSQHDVTTSSRDYPHNVTLSLQEGGRDLDKTRESQGKGLSEGGYLTPVPKHCVTPSHASKYGVTASPARQNDVAPLRHYHHDVTPSLQEGGRDVGKTVESQGRDLSEGGYLTPVHEHCVTTSRASKRDVTASTARQDDVASSSRDCHHDVAPSLQEVGGYFDKTGQDRGVSEGSYLTPVHEHYVMPTHAHHRDVTASPACQEDVASSSRDCQNDVTPCGSCRDVMLSEDSLCDATESACRPTGPLELQSVLGRHPGLTGSTPGGPLYTPPLQGNPLSPCPGRGDGSDVDADVTSGGEATGAGDCETGCRRWEAWNGGGVGQDGGVDSPEHRKNGDYLTRRLHSPCKGKVTEV